jgi:hypothetical protein
MIKLKCVIMRGGTSRAVFFHENELPSDPELRDKVVLDVFGSPDIREIDGLGGADELRWHITIYTYLSCLGSFFCEGGRPRLPGRRARPSRFSSLPSSWSPINGRPMV